MAQSGLHYGAAIRQEPREGRTGSTVERGDAAGARQNATQRDRGFTLVEVMVTLLLLGLVTGVALLALPSGNARLAREAEQLALRIKHAQREAMLTNRAVELVVAGHESRFRVRRGGRWQALAEAPFQPRPWPQGVRAAAAGVRFDPSGATEPASIRLSARDRVLDLTVDAQGDVRIHER